MRFGDPNGMVVHAEVQIGDSPIAIAEEVRDWGNLRPQALGGSPVVMQLYVDDVDAVASQAVAAGATIVFPVADQFYGNRSGRIADPFGHVWIVATHKEDVPVDEMRRRAEAWMQQEGPHQAHAAVASATASSTEPKQALIPFLQVRGADRFIDFLKQAFDAEEAFCHRSPTGAVEHAKIRIGDSFVEMGEAHGPYQPTPTAIHLYVGDTDGTYRRALAAGASSLFEPVDKEYGERLAGVKDRFGTIWYIATPKKE